MSMEDILKVLVDSRQQGGSSNAADPMADLVGSLLGGGQPQPQITGNQQSGGLGDMMGLLETVMGGRQGGTSTYDPIMALLQPYVAPLAKKANISPEIALVVVSFVAHKLLAHHPTSRRDSNSFNFEDMFQQMGTGKIDSNMLQSSGMVKEISAKTGLDEATAAKSLNAAFGMMGSKMQSGRSPSPKPKVPTRQSGKSLGAKGGAKPGKKK